MANDPIKGWLNSCVASLDLPGSPWHAAKRDILKNLTQKLHSRGYTDEYLQISYELDDKLHLTDLANNEQHKANDKLDAKRRKILKVLIAIAARESGCDSNLETARQSAACSNLIVYIQNILKLNCTKLFTSKPSPMARHEGCGANIRLLIEGDKDTELVGSVLSQILDKDSKQLAKIALRLKGHVIPNALRESLYRRTLLNIVQNSRAHDAAKFRDEDYRREFAKKVKSGLIELNIRDPTKSPVQHLIQTTIIDLYETLPTLAKLSKAMKFQKMSSTVLNVNYTSTKKFKYQYGLWLFPLQLVAPGDGSKEHIYELAMQLNILLEFCFELSYENEISIKVWERLINDHSGIGSKIVQHFQSLGVDVSMDNVALHLETDMGSATDNASYPAKPFFQDKVKSHAVNEKSHKNSFLAKSHPILCIRKWIGNLFVGFTNIPVTAFFFDQFFLRSWDHETIVVSCLSLVSVISNLIMKSTTVEEACAVMLMETKHAKADEVYVTWNHLQQ